MTFMLATKTKELKSMKLLYLLLSVCVFFLVSCGDSEKKKDPLVHVSDDDTEMAQAFKLAKENISILDENIGKENVRTSIKVEFPYGEDSEYCWVSEITKDGENYIGRLSNEPVNNIGYKIGDEITTKKDKIVDWIVMSDGPALGNYTLRALFKNMSKEDIQKAKRVMKWED